MPQGGKFETALIRSMALSLVALPVMLFSVINLDVNKRYLFDWFGIQEPSRVILWAWERDEDLSFLDPKKFQVAYFTEHIFVRDGNVMFQPRKQKLVLPSKIVAFPVFRIDSLRAPGHDAPSLSSASRVVDTICERLQELPSTKVVQLDFDALQDERPFYRQLLKELRHKLPAGTKISITALSSWLLSDRWLHDGDADEVVAMLFSIGPDRRNVLQRLHTQPLNSGTRARLCVGLSASEKPTNRAVLEAQVLNQTDTVYFFSPNGWTKSRLESITSEVLN